MTVHVNDLDEVVHAVPNFAAERKFFGETCGLTEVGEAGGKIDFAAEGSTHLFVTMDAVKELW